MYSSYLPALARRSDRSSSGIATSRYAQLTSANTSRVFVMRARAHIARGRYQEAEKLLTPAVAAAPGSDAALELGLLQVYLGRRDEATRTLSRVVNGSQSRTAPDLLRMAQAARALGRFQDSNTLFRDADRAQPKDAAINTAWGELFLEKAEKENAQKSFEIALQADANNPAAIIGMARIASDTDQPAAAQLVERALKINPNYVPAHLLVSEMALDNRERQDAHASIDKALEINPNSLEARTLDAALAFLEDRKTDFDQKAEAVLKLNRVYSEVYRVAGDHATRNYRFQEAIPLTRKAIALEPNNARAHADLGLELLRVGDEAAGRTELETAYKLDPFQSSLVTKNLLTMAVSGAAVVVYTVAALLIAVNWFTYVWAVNHDYVVETSLGYFITPLVNVLLGVAVLRESLRPAQWAAVGLAAAGVAYLTTVYGAVPWIALALAISFGTYGLVKKKAPMPPLPGLTLETGLLFVPAVAFLVSADMRGVGAFGHAGVLPTILMAGAGVVTTVPLLMFATAVRHVRLSVIGILQFIAPTIQFVLGVFVYREPFSRSQLVGFGLVWTALAVFAVESWQRRGN